MGSPDWKEGSHFRRMKIVIRVEADMSMSHAKDRKQTDVICSEPDNSTHT